NMAVCVRVSRPLQGSILPLNMATQSMAASYEACEKEMQALVMSHYYLQELNATNGFSDAWDEAVTNAKPGIDIQLSAAIYMYTVEKENDPKPMYTQLDSATRTGRAAYESGDFQFHTLHFFLTDVLDQTIRFGSFTSSSLDMNQISFGKESCFQIYTCYGTDVSKLSAFESGKEVLISPPPPPPETFTNLECSVVYKLKSAGKKKLPNFLFKKNNLKNYILFFI
uniref:NAD(P)(+)--arginine ADP-ribosyltransferase n=1 Tax=Electrophorus electricus TaxID=8005 RepID=A0A4W4H6X0_ELEEL